MNRTLTKDSWIELKRWGWGCTPSQLIQFIEIAFCLLIFSQTQINFLANLYFTSTQENSRFLESFFISYRIDTTTELTTQNIQLRLTLLPTLQTKCNIVGNYQIVSWSKLPSLLKQMMTFYFEHSIIQVLSEVHASWVDNDDIHSAHN